MAALRDLAPEEAKIAENIAEMVQFKPEEVEVILSLACMEVSRWVLGRMERELITLEEADRWAKCTRIVFWQYLQRADAAMVVWVLLTVGMFASKKSLKPKEKPKPKGPENAQSNSVDKPGMP